MLFPLDSRVVRTHGRIEGREVSRDRCLRGDEGKQAAGMERGQKTRSSVCCCVVKGNLGRRVYLQEAFASSRCPPPTVLGWRPAKCQGGDILSPPGLWVCLAPPHGPEGRGQTLPEVGIHHLYASVRIPNKEVIILPSLYHALYELVRRLII